jgi:hypothetical protein
MSPLLCVCVGGGGLYICEKLTYFISSFLDLFEVCTDEVINFLFLACFVAKTTKICYSLAS